MTPEQAQFLLTHVYLPQIHNEAKTTRKVIAAIPADKCCYKPADDSMSGIDLAWHIATADCMFMNGIASGTFATGSAPKTPETMEGVLAWYDENFAKASAAMGAATAEELVKPLDFHGVFNYPAIVYAGFMLSHSIHHRGQLSTYLRPMGAKVPSIYGGSYDEPFQMPAKA